MLVGLGCLWSAGRNVFEGGMRYNIMGRIVEGWAGAAVHPWYLTAYHGILPLVTNALSSLRSSKEIEKFKPEGTVMKGFYWRIKA